MVVTIVGAIALTIATSVVTWYGISEHYTGVVETELKQVSSNIGNINGQILDINHHIHNLELAFAHSNPKVPLSTIEQISNITDNNYKIINQVLGAWQEASGSDEKVFQEQLLNIGLTNEQSLKIGQVLYQSKVTDKVKHKQPSPPQEPE
ncbi:MAG TPA: hypothetical protein VNE40_04965 [Candidatus Dormibacteraeota bacterium]|nr:hypothetical protein [Candidatus Dormibacteraeota bacterium]